MTTLAVAVNGSAVAFVAETQTFNYGDDLVEVRPITPEEFLVCDESRFVAPEGEEWIRCDRVLREHKVLVLRGDAGTGRHTAALRQLLNHVKPERIHELEPTWTQPQRRFLPPAVAGHGYIIDLSDTAKEPSEDFGKALLSWPKEGQALLVVLVTGDIWAGQWTHQLRDQLVSLPSPNARRLVARQLNARGASNRTFLLSHEALAPIWTSSPRAEDASRLAEIIRKSSSLNVGDIAAEYGGWEAWLDKKFPAQLGSRTLLWSAALCDGGRRLSILQMSEALRRKLGEDRGPAAVLADAPASKRLDDAHIKRVGDRVQLAPECHGLPAAARRHLWDECQLHRDLLTDWAVNQAANLPADDAEKVVEALLELTLHFRDKAIINKLRDALLTKRRSTLAQALSKAAIDSRFGPYIRGRLYNWLANSPSQERVDLVAEVCGGAFGRQAPERALVRLHLAALKTTNALSIPLAAAFTSLAISHRQTVLQTLFKWLDTPESERAGIVAFLGLASTHKGMVLLCGSHLQELSRPEDQEAFSFTIRQGLARPETQEATYKIMTGWKSMVERDQLPESLVIEILASSLAPSIKDNVITRLMMPDEVLDMNTFWGKVLLRAAQQLPQTPEPMSSPSLVIHRSESF
ncbi:hypothetical protein AB0H88_14565 [Nonomuraea sp. NPDC050680]|uniref:hypothetical protein n=1 Tax=Nonomuraea sp. NPDC050680 TaxID=3154630 RepID=UPI003404E07C